MWLLARIGAVALCAGAVLAIPVARSNLDRSAALLIGLVTSAAVFGWLMAIRSRQRVDWSDPYSFWKPFWLMYWYPLRYWLVVSVGLMLGGAAGITMVLRSHSNRTGVPGTFLVTGLWIYIALQIFVRNYAPAGDRLH